MVYIVHLAAHPKCHVYLIRIKDPATMEQMGLPFVLQVHGGDTHSQICVCARPVLSVGHVTRVEVVIVFSQAE